MIRVRVVMVNYKTADLAIRCLQALAEERQILQHIDVEAYVVDNYSGDGSAEKLQAAVDTHQWSEWMRVIAADSNGGFAYGNNLAMRPSLTDEPRPDYIWLLNPDTCLRPGATKALVEFMQINTKAGLAVSRLEDEDGTPQAAGFRFPSVISEMLGAARLGVLDRLFHNHKLVMPITEQASQADWLAGASLIIRKDVLDDIGIMDETYFLYYEELDYCFQAKKQGWELWTVPNSRVFHIVGASTGISDTRKQAPRRPQYWFDSRRRYFLKNYSPWRVALVDFFWMAGYATWLLRAKIQNKENLDPPHFFSDYFKNSVFCKGFKLTDD